MLYLYSIHQNCQAAFGHYEDQRVKIISSWASRKTCLQAEMLFPFSLTFIFLYSIIDITTFDSDNFNLISENCMKHEIFIIFTCITLYFCCYDPKTDKIQRQLKFSLNFWGENLSFYSKFLSHWPLENWMMIRTWLYL